MNRKGLIIAGLAGGSGKSVVAVGLIAALARAGRRVVPFKKGPDYIDAGWLQLAAGRNCYNLDPYLMSREAILTSFATRSADAEMVIVEGNRGLYDGVDVAGGYSTAELALMLNLPVLLVVNCAKITRTVAALVLGCQQFDRRLTICGVVLNNVATERQKRLVSEAVEKYTAIPVLGAIPRLKRDIFPMRHLGMVPHQEYPANDQALTILADLAKEHLDLPRVEAVMAELPPLPASMAMPRQANCPSLPPVKIGVIQDAAFQFYYAENLQALERAGAELIWLNAMRDPVLPPLDGLYIGGGFPETGARALAANASFRQAVKVAAHAGLPIYAECGGLIYLGRSIVLDNEEYPLVDLFPVRFAMSTRPQAHGYTVFTADRDNPFYPPGTEVKGHEFRYSKIIDWEGHESNLVLKMSRGCGFCHGRDGLVLNNVLALYSHIHADGTPNWAESLVARCREVKG